MHKDLILLAIAAIFGLGATVAGVAAPSRFRNTPAWVWHWLFWGGIILMAIMLIDGLWLWFQRPSIRTAGLINVGLFFLSCGVISYYDERINTIHRTDITVGKPKSTTLFLECVATIAPHRMPESGVIWTLQLQTDGDGGGALGQISGAPGGEMGAWFSSGYRCEVTNYGDKPVANVEITLDLITYAAIPLENGFHNGAQSAHKEILVRIPKIDSGKDNPFTFYIFNMAKQFMEVRFLEKTKLTVIGDGKEYDGTLQQSYLAVLNLPPRP